MFTIQLSDTDLPAVRHLIDDLAAEFDSVEDDAFLAACLTYAQELPRPVRTGLNRFRLHELDGVCLIRGYPIDDAAIGPTPQHWHDLSNRSRTLHEEIFFSLVSTLLGDPVAWSTQQDGRVMHNVLPIMEHEDEQIGSGSRQLLTWHTEDAFHPLRTDYIGLMCMRNPDDVRTTYACGADLRLDGPVSDVLREELFAIRPDHSHLPGHTVTEPRRSGKVAELLDLSYQRVREWDRQPERVAVLYGDREQPYLRLDPYFMSTEPGDERAADALATIVAEIDRVLGGYSLNPGEVIFLDNNRVVHGREPFVARYDGTDRWLKRLNIARDLRKSRAWRLSAADRIIY